jgi:hypothetical protein
VLQITYGVAAIRQKHDLLIHLQTLRFQHLVKPALGLGVVLVDERKHLGVALGLDALAGNDFEPRGAIERFWPKVAWTRWSVCQ